MKSKFFGTAVCTNNKSVPILIYKHYLFKKTMCVLMSMYQCLSAAFPVELE